MFKVKVYGYDLRLVIKVKIYVYNLRIRFNIIVYGQMFLTIFMVML